MAGGTTGGSAVAVVAILDRQGRIGQDMWRPWQMAAGVLASPAGLVIPGTGRRRGTVHLDAAVKMIPPLRQFRNSPVEQQVAGLHGDQFAGPVIPGTVAATTLIMAQQRDSRMVYRQCSREGIGCPRRVSMTSGTNEGELRRRYMATGTGRRSAARITGLDVVAEFAGRQHIAGREMGPARAGEVSLEGPSITAIRVGSARAMTRLAPLGQVAQGRIETRITPCTSSGRMTGLAIDQIALGNRTMQDRIDKRQGVTGSSGALVAGCGSSVRVLKTAGKTARCRGVGGNPGTWGGSTVTACAGTGNCQARNNSMEIVRIVCSYPVGRVSFGIWMADRAVAVGNAEDSRIADEPAVKQVGRTTVAVDAVIAHAQIVVATVPGGRTVISWQAVSGCRDMGWRNRRSERMTGIEHSGGAGEIHGETAGG